MNDIKTSSLADRLTGVTMPLTPNLDRLHSALVDRSAVRRICDLIDGTAAGTRLTAKDVLTILDALQCAFHDRGHAAMDVACELANCWTAINDMVPDEND